ncbi:hypothetical protein PRIPAC_77664 [Pristionchus pacificus]|nr:hypothetical protein PRIPAC_77664 [Pristionchus pacificus]
MAKKFAVDLYFDLFSPYSFIIYRSKWPMEVTLKPFDLSSIYEKTGNATNPVKLPYIGKDAIRLARYHNIPLKFRKDFIKIVSTKSSASGHRLIAAVQLGQPDKGEAVARALYRRIWIDQGDIFETKDFLEVLASCGVNNADAVLSSVSSAIVNDEIEKNTEEAIGTGCFGAPWTVVTLENGKKDAFFGSDRINVIGHMMGCKFDGPLTSSL